MENHIARYAYSILPNMHPPILGNMPLPYWAICSHQIADMHILNRRYVLFISPIRYCLIEVTLFSGLVLL